MPKYHRKQQENPIRPFDLWRTVQASLRLVVMEKKAFFKCSLLPLVMMVVIIVGYGLFVPWSDDRAAIEDFMYRPGVNLSSPFGLMVNAGWLFSSLSGFLLLLVLPLLVFAMNWQSFVLYEAWGPKALYRHISAEQTGKQKTAKQKAGKEKVSKEKTGNEQTGNEKADLKQEKDEARDILLSWFRAAFFYVLKSLLLIIGVIVIIQLYLAALNGVGREAGFLGFCIAALGAISFPLLMKFLCRVSFMFPLLLDGADAGVKNALSKTGRIGWQLFAGSFLVINIVFYLLAIVLPIVLGVLGYILPGPVMFGMVILVFIYAVFAMLAFMVTVPAVAYMQHFKKFQLRWMLICG